MSDGLQLDVAVVGGGACGVMTGLRASLDPELVVGVFEKSTREGCNAQVSSGSLAAGGTRFQREAGIDDSPQRHADDLLAASGDRDRAELVRAVCAVAPTYVEWVADELGYPIEIGIDMPRKGQSVARLHVDPGRCGGGPLMAHMRRALLARENAAFVDQAPAVGLVVEDGRVVGVKVRQNGAVTTVRAKTVVLALDGFAGNAAYMKRFCSELGDPFYGGVSTSTGDAIPWLQERGAAFANMGACLRHGQVVVGHGTRVNPSLPWYGAVLVNTGGERFVDEQAEGYSGLAGVIQRQPRERAAMIWDDEAMAGTITSELMRESLAAGAIRGVATLEELAGIVGVGLDAMQRALVARPLRRQLVAPYHLAWVTHGVLTTQGGVEIDTLGHVLRAGGSRIEGLRAGGGTAVGFAGPNSGGYSSGAGLLAAFGMGWIIGNDLAGVNGTEPT